MSLMLSSRTVSLAAAVCGGLFVGYCIYFDKKRRSHPDFKKNLRERRKQQELERKAGTKYPDLTNVSATHAFFVEEIEKGEDSIASGDVEKGVEHFANAIAVCAQPDQILNLLRQTLPPQIFLLIIQKLPEVKQKIDAVNQPQIIIKTASSPGPGLIIDEELE